MDHVLKLKKLGYNKSNPINDLTDIKISNILYYLCKDRNNSIMSNVSK